MDPTSSPTSHFPYRQLCYVMEKSYGQVGLAEPASNCRAVKGELPWPQPRVETSAGCGSRASSCHKHNCIACDPVG